MTLQYTEHPTPKISLLVFNEQKPEPPKSTASKFMNRLYEAQLRSYEDRLSKCKQVEVTEDSDIPELLYHGWYMEGYYTFKDIRLKDGDTFEIDDEKVSVEMGCKWNVLNRACMKTDCDDSETEMCDHYKSKIATLKLKETVKEDSNIADRMAKVLKRLTDGLAKDGTAIEGFIDAIAIQHEYAKIKLEKELQKIKK